MSNIKKSSVNETSIAAYCLIMVLYCFNKLGFTLIFWIYFLLMILFSIAYCYRIYFNDEKNKTFTFFQLDSFSIGLFLLTIYFDSKYNFINFELNSLTIYFLILGLILVLENIIKYIFLRKKN